MERIRIHLNCMNQDVAGTVHCDSFLQHTCSMQEEGRFISCKVCGCLIKGLFVCLCVCVCVCVCV